MSKKTLNPEESNPPRTTPLTPNLRQVTRKKMAPNWVIKKRDVKKEYFFDDFWLRNTVKHMVLNASRKAVRKIRLRSP